MSHYQKSLCHQRIHQDYTSENKNGHNPLYEDCHLDTLTTLQNIPDLPESDSELSTAESQVWREKEAEERQISVQKVLNKICVQCATANPQSWPSKVSQALSIAGANHQVKSDESASEIHLNLNLSALDEIFPGYFHLGSHLFSKIAPMQEWFICQVMVQKLLCARLVNWSQKLVQGCLSKFLWTRVPLTNDSVTLAVSTPANQDSQQSLAPNLIVEQ